MRGLVCKAHRLVYHSNLGWRATQEKRRGGETAYRDPDGHSNAPVLFDSLWVVMVVMVDSLGACMVDSLEAHG